MKRNMDQGFCMTSHWAKFVDGFVIVLLMISASPVRAVPVASDTFDGTSADGWAVVFGDGHTTISGANDDVLEWTGGTSPGFAEARLEAASESDSDLADYNSGDWAESAAQSLRFDFDYSASGAPAALSMYFTVDGSAYWYYDINLTGSGSQYGADLSYDYGTGWYLVGSGTQSEAAFISALASVDIVGLYVAYEVDQIQTFSVDNFVLDNEAMPLGGGSEIPEPEVYLALAMVLISMVTVFRGRLNEQLNALLATVRR